MNANVLQRWLNEHAQSGCHQIAPPDMPPAHLPPPAFLAVQLPAPAAQPAAPPVIRLELRFGDGDYLAQCSGSRVRSLGARGAAVIRIDALWLAVQPTDMRAGADRLLASVVQVFGSAQAHHSKWWSSHRVAWFSQLG